MKDLVLSTLAQNVRSELGHRLAIVTALSSHLSG